MAKTIVMYGIPNCNTVKKARTWLDEKGQAYAFHNFKKEGLDAQTLDELEQAVGWELLLNKRGTTWRKLDDTVKAGVTDAASAKQVMLDNLSVIKRPVVVWADGNVTVGFDADAWTAYVA